MQTGAKIRMDDLFAYAFVIAFKLPNMAGYGEHWELKKEEAKQLGASLKACIETIPEERKRRVMKRVENILPWCALLAYGGMATYTRIKITQMMLEEQRHRTRYNVENIRPEHAQHPIAESPVENSPQPGGTYSGGKSIPAPFDVPA